MALTVPAGAQLGRYEIVKHLASGLMAELLLARARGLEGFERHFVIKRIRAEQERDEAFIEMFLAEARLAAALHHHNIVQVHDIGEDDGKPYFAMEYVHGEDLRRVLGRLFERSEHVPLEHVISIVCSVAGALHHAHEALGPDRQSLGIVHRDVTPANILLGYDGNVKVVDFGIARAAMRRTETQAGMLVGKAPYMAPEQCVGGAIDRRSDVFALGIVLFELITGRRLFKGDNEFLTMSAVVEANVPPPSAHRSDVSPALDKIVLKALSRDPAQRYQTAEQMFYALDLLASAEELRSSGLALAGFMKELFGHRVEPWLGSDDRPRSTSPDFDGAHPGLAAPPTGALDNYTEPVSSKKVSPITRARNNAISDQPATAPAVAAPQPIIEARSAAVRIPDGPVVAAGRARDKAAFRTTQVPVAPMPTRPRPKTKTVQIPVTASARPEPIEDVSTRVDPLADLLEIPVEAAAAPVASSAVKVDSTAAPMKVVSTARKDATPAPAKIVSTTAPRKDATPAPAKIVSTTAPRKDATPPPTPASTTGPRKDAPPVKVESTTAPRKDATPPPTPAEATAPRNDATPAKIVSTTAPRNDATPPPMKVESTTAPRNDATPAPKMATSTSAAANDATRDARASGKAASKASDVAKAASDAFKAPPTDASKPAASPRPSSGLSVTAFAQKPGGAPATAKLPSVISPSSPSTLPSASPAPVGSSSWSALASAPAGASPIAASPNGATEAPKRNTPPPMQALTDEKRSTLQGMQPLAPISQAMAPVVESSQTMAPQGARPSSRRMPLPVEDPETETEIDPLSSRQGEVAAKGVSIWNNPEMFEPDEPSVVVRSKSLVLAALAAEAAKTDAEDARADAEDARAEAERVRADSQIEPPTRVEGPRAASDAQTFAEQTAIDDGPSSLGDDGPTSVANDPAIADDGPTSVMPDRPTNDVPQPPSAMPAGWMPPGAQMPRALTPRPGGPPERGSQDRITPLPPPPMMPEITDYPRLRPDHQGPPIPTVTATPVQGWMPAAPTVDAPRMSSRNKKLIIGGAGALLLIVIIVFATRGGGDDEAKTAAGGSDVIATPKTPEPTTPTETPTPTERPNETGTATPPPPTPPPDKTTPRPPKKPVKATPKVAAKPPVKKPPVKKPPVKKPPVKKPPPKDPGWDPNSLFPKKK